MDGNGVVRGSAPAWTSRRNLMLIVGALIATGGCHGTHSPSQLQPAREPHSPPDKERRERIASEEMSSEMGAIAADSLATLGRGVGSSRQASGGGAMGKVAALRSHGPTEFNTEAYAHNADNVAHNVVDSALSTFSIDVDTASYSNVRRFLRDRQRPPVDAVRIEELINYFRYDYPDSKDATPFAISTEIASAPWNPRNRLVRIGLRAREIAQQHVPARNLVFLVDVSGSMQSNDKLPLLKHGLAMLVGQLRPVDHIALVAYAGASGLVLPATSGRERGRILQALEALEAGGSTNGAEGIQLAYQVARENFVEGGINRVILATDGDFNVGVTSEGDLTRLIEKKRESGVFLTVLGFGTGNLKDTTMETLADKGNGHYAYIDSAAEAHKVLVREAGSTLVTVAKDVKLQVEWNPKQVATYRLIGYENRVLADRDFNDDKKDAGDLGAGHTVTALYEVELAARQPVHEPEVDALRYQADRALTPAADNPELLTVKVRYKRPDANDSALLSEVAIDRGLRIDESSADLRWSAAVAGFGMLLRGSAARGDATLGAMRALARAAVGSDPHGDRREFLRLMEQAAQMGIGG